MKKVAILQSNYVPWKGYFDLLASVDEFIIYDDVQFTKNDWRNRNRIKTQNGIQWLSVPVGANISRKVWEVEIADKRWPAKHWATLSHSYRRARYFSEIAERFAPLYLDRSYTHLSELNRVFIESICAQLQVTTKITDSRQYLQAEGQTERLVSLCEQAGATEYVSGPAARGYLDAKKFAERGIAVTWFDYADYPSYPQLWGEFEHGVSILDLLFNTGPDAGGYMKYVDRRNAGMANTSVLKGA